MSSGWFNTSEPVRTTVQHRKRGLCRVVDKLWQSGTSLASYHEAIISPHHRLANFSSPTEQTFTPSEVLDIPSEVCGDSEMSWECKASCGSDC